MPSTVPLTHRRGKTSEGINHRVYEEICQPVLRAAARVGRQAYRRRAAQQRVAACRFYQEGRPRVVRRRALRDRLRSRTGPRPHEGNARGLSTRSNRLGHLRDPVHRSHARAANRRDRAEGGRGWRLSALQRGPAAPLPPPARCRVPERELGRLELEIEHLGMAQGGREGGSSGRTTTSGRRPRNAAR